MRKAATYEKAPVGSTWFRAEKSIKFTGQISSAVSSEPSSAHPASTEAANHTAPSNPTLGSHTNQQLSVGPPSPSKFQAPLDFDLGRYVQELGITSEERRYLEILGFAGEALEVVESSEALAAGFKVIPWKRLVVKDRAYRARNHS